MKNQKKVRILRIIARLNIGGPSIQAISLSKDLSRENYETLLACGNIGETEGDMSYLAREMGVEPCYIPELGREISFMDDFRALFALRKIIKEFKPHIIHTHTAKAGTLGRLAGFSINIFKRPGRKCRMVHTFHGNIFSGYFGKIKTLLFILIERFLAGISDKIIVISRQQKMDICEKYKVVNSKKVEIIRLGFDLTKFSRNGDLYIHKRKQFVSPEEPNVLLVGIVGRLTAIKNHRMLLDAIRYLKEQGEVDKFRFLIVGDGEIRETLEDYACIHGIDKYVIFSGWQKDMPSVYNSIDIAVLTSLNEGTPVTLIEAMAAATPVVSTDVGGVKDLMGYDKVRDPKGFDLTRNGILVSSGDYLSMAEALMFMVENNEACLNMAEQAKAFVLKEYSKERLVKDIDLLYSELVTHSS